MDFRELTQAQYQQMNAQTRQQHAFASLAAQQQGPSPFNEASRQVMGLGACPLTNAPGALNVFRGIGGLGAGIGGIFGGIGAGMPPMRRDADGDLFQSSYVSITDSDWWTLEPVLDHFIKHKAVYWTLFGIGMAVLQALEKGWF